MLPVYQQVTSLADEQLVLEAGLLQRRAASPPTPWPSRASLIDDSQAGGYSAIATQFHVDYYLLAEVEPWVDGTLAYAASPHSDVDGRALAALHTRTRAATTMTNPVWNAATGS